MNGCASKFDDAASARGRDLMMRNAGARIMSISGRLAQGCGLLEGQDERDYCPVHELALPAPGAALKLNFINYSRDVREYRFQHFWP